MEVSKKSSTFVIIQKPPSCKINHLKHKKMIRDIFEDIPILSSIIAIFILGLVFLLIDGIASKPEPFYGSVIDKHYKAERNQNNSLIELGQPPKYK